ncbi:serine/threonine receptor-like kinase NFP [Rutidosis leptorrhynchoides]|uniref:serine/threonine receptor-like kinase NFP n=1 Tax=Rutidosis leptorrhynchoides TaxID=125765 RepID=UPI003A994104
MRQSPIGGDLSIKIISMAFSYFKFLAISVLFIYPFYVFATPADTNFSCSAASPPSCQTYITYRARQPYMDLGNISDLFGVSRLSIAKASNLTSENEEILYDQLLLIPITCSCNGENYFSNVTYTIKKGDSFYVVATSVFQNLTNFLDDEDMNPSLNPTNLTVGDPAVFPLLCKCPTQLQNQEKYLITYVWQPKDEILPVSHMFNTSSYDIGNENNFRNFTAAVCLPVLIPISKLPIFPLPKRLSDSKRVGLKKIHVLFLILATVVGFFVFLSLLWFVLYKYRSRKTKKILARNDSSFSFTDLLYMKRGSKHEVIVPAKTNQDKLLPGVSGYLSKPIMYERKEIMDATMNLSERYRIGGSVYKAVINGQVLAVKKFRDATEELKILQRVNHTNLVKMMGISSDLDGSCFLVYEYAENGSLDKWLFPKPLSSSPDNINLSWSQRLNIALDIANGLQYMHEHSQPSMAHRDLRTSNILLDTTFKAKVANFSTARPAISSIMLKVDVFAFGVILLELLSGRKAMESRDDGEICMSWKEIKNIIEDDKDKREENLRLWMDPKLGSFYPIDGALNLAALARACTSEKSANRPGMTEIVFNLSVLTQSSSDEIYEQSWTSTVLDTEDSHVISPIIAR